MLNRLWERFPGAATWLAAAVIVAGGIVAAGAASAHGPGPGPGGPGYGGPPPGGNWPGQWSGPPRQHLPPPHRPGPPSGFWFGFGPGWGAGAWHNPGRLVCRPVYEGRWAWGFGGWRWQQVQVGQNCQRVGW